MHIGMNPDLLQAGGFVVSWHGFLTFVSVAMAVVLIAWWARRVDILPDVVYSTAVWAIVGGIIGARAVHVIDRWDFYRDNLSQIPSIWNGGIAIFGAVLGGFVGGYLFIRVRTWMQARALKKVSARYASPSDIQERGGYAYFRFPANQDANLPAIARALAGEVVEEEGRKRVRVASFSVGALADLSAPAVILAMALGRVGDIINGEHVSKATTMPWGFVYTNPASPTNQQYGITPTHPTMVYEMLWDLAVFGILWGLRGRLRPPGMLFAAMLAAYSIGRFFISFLRIDKEWLAGLNQAQLISLVVLAITVPLLAYRAQFVRRARSSEKKAKAASAE